MRAKAGATAGSPRRWTPASPLSSGPGASGRVEGFEAVLARNKNSNSARRRISEARRSQPIALTLSPAPEGFARWSLRLPEEKVVELIVERAKDNANRADAEKTFSPHQQQWVIPLDANAAFVATMEDVLVSIMTATGSAAPARVPRRNLEAADHRHARADPRQTWTTVGVTITNTERNGVANLFMVFAPLALAACQGHRPPHRHRLCPRAQDLSDTHFFRMRRKSLRVIINIHKPASIYEAFPAPEAWLACRALRTALHAQARQLARHGRTEPWRSRVANASGSPHRRQANTRPRSYRRDGVTTATPRQSRLAIHNRQRPRQAEEITSSRTRATSRKTWIIALIAGLPVGAEFDSACYRRNGLWDRPRVLPPTSKCL